MDSTMMDYPLTITTVMRYGTTVFGDKEVVTCAGDEPARRRSYAAVGERAARLANALRSLGVDADQRVGTFMWNNAEHLEAYLAIPSMGAVMHTLNLRLSPDQVGYIAAHAGDYAVIVDASLVPLFANVLPLAETIKHVIVSGAGRRGRAKLARRPRPRGPLLRGATRRRGGHVGWPDLDERSAAAMCYTSGTTGLPKGVVYSHRSSYLHSMAACSTNGLGVGEHDRVMPIVPQFHANAWGLPYAAMMSGADLVMPDRFMIPAAIVKLVEAEKVTVGAGVPTIWQGVLAHLRANGGDISSLRTLVCGGSALPESVMRAYSDEFGLTDDARLGDDRAFAARGRWPASRAASPARPYGPTGRRRGACSAASRASWPAMTGRSCRPTARRSANWSAAARGSRRLTTSTTRQRSSMTAGCAPATSAPWTPRASSGSPTGPRT